MSVGISLLPSLKNLVTVFVDTIFTNCVYNSLFIVHLLAVRISSYGWINITFMTEVLSDQSPNIFDISILGFFSNFTLEAYTTS